MCRYGIEEGHAKGMRGRVDCGVDWSGYIKWSWLDWMAMCRYGIVGFDCGGGMGYERDNSNHHYYFLSLQNVKLHTACMQQIPSSCPFSDRLRRVFFYKI